MRRQPTDYMPDSIDARIRLTSATPLNRLEPESSMKIEVKT